MTDSTLNAFLGYGTAAARAAFTPSPPSPASGAGQAYFWFETDTSDTYCYHGGSWTKVNTAASAVTTTGSPASGNLAKFSGAASVTNGDLSGDVTTSGTLAATIAANAVTTTKINNSAVTLAKIANQADQTLLSNISGGSAAPSANTLTAIIDAILGSTQGDLLYRNGTVWTVLAPGTAGQVLKTGGAAANPAWADSVATITFIIDGGGSAITTGIKGDLEIPFGCTITAATLLADQSGSIVVDIWKDTYANYPPTVAKTITASALPTISTAVKAQDTTLTGWTTAIAAGDTLRFNVNSATTITRVTLSLKVKKT